MLGTLNALLWRVGLGLAVIALAAATASSASAAAPAHGVWVANGAANTLTEFSFAAGAAASPIATIASNSGSLSTPSGIALDGRGDLWVANAGNDTIVEYTPDQVAQDGSPVPALTLGSGGGLFRPTGLAFDASGNLWATNVGDSTIVEYTAQQLGAGSHAAPAVTISADGTHILDSPVFPAFDVQGDLWVPNLANNTVAEYTPSQLAASGAPVPATTISSTTGAGALNLPWAVRFDAKGDLWVVNRNDDTLLEYAPGNLGTGAQSPSAVITSSSLSSPQGADFDLAGDLWVASAGSNTVSQFTPSQLGASGSPQGASTISSSALSNPTGIVVAQAPVVSTLTEKQTSAGTEVTITGRGFYPGASVHFGSTPAASVTYLSPFELKVLAPSGRGQVDVTVSTGEGTSAISPGDVYVFGGVSPTLIVSKLGAGVINLYPLGASGDYAPSAAINAGLSQPTREALDGAGNLWVVNAGAKTILEYTRAQLQAADLAAPAATLRLASSGPAPLFVAPSALAFDASGNLWIGLITIPKTGVENGLVDEIPRQQLADGTASPAVTFATAGPVGSVAFDNQGDLWTVDLMDGVVSEYVRSELAAGVPHGPVTVLTDDGNGSLTTAAGLTFDAAGDLWVANAAGSLVKFTPAELQTGTPVPAVTVTPQEPSLQTSGPAFAFGDLAFDAAGNLWALSNPGGAAPSISELTPDQLAASGSPLPHDTIAGIDTGLSGAYGLALAQPPTVSAVAPASGPSGAQVTISGAGFHPGATVEFGSAPATSVTDVSPYELTAVAPAGTGTVDVTVTTGEGPSTDSPADRFTYDAQSSTTTTTTTTTTTSSTTARPPVAHPRIALGSTHINVTRGAAQLRLACTLAPCHGTIKLTLQLTTTTRHGRHVIRRHTTLTLATARYTLAAGRRRILDLTLSRRGRTALSHAPGQRLVVRATVTVTGGATLNKPVLLVVARRPRPRR